jgi:hypothetical protein
VFEGKKRRREVIFWEKIELESIELNMLKIHG